MKNCLQDSSLYTPLSPGPRNGICMNNWKVLKGKKISKLTCASSSFVQKMVKMRNLKLPASTISCLTNPPLACLTFCLLHIALLYFTSLCSIALLTCLTYFLFLFLLCLLPYFAFCFCFFFSTFILYLLCLSCFAYFLYFFLDLASLTFRTSSFT